MVLVLLVEYYMVTEVTNSKEEFSTWEMDEHKTICYYMMNNDHIEEQNSIFEKPDLGRSEPC